MIIRPALNEGREGEGCDAQAPLSLAKGPIFSYSLVIFPLLFKERARVRMNLKIKLDSLR